MNIHFLERCMEEIVPRSTILFLLQPKTTNWLFVKQKAPYSELPTIGCKQRELIYCLSLSVVLCTEVDQHLTVCGVVHSHIHANNLHSGVYQTFVRAKLWPLLKKDQTSFRLLIS